MLATPLALNAQYVNESSKMENQRASFNSRPAWRLYAEASMFGAASYFLTDISGFIAFHKSPYFHFAFGVGMVGEELFDVEGISCTVRSRSYLNENNFSPFLDVDAGICSVSLPNRGFLNIGPGLSWNIGGSELYICAFYRYTQEHGGGFRAGLAF